MTMQHFDGDRPDSHTPPPPIEPEAPEAFEVELRLNGEVITPQRAHCVICGAKIPGTAAFCLDCEDYVDGDGMGYPFQPEPF